MLLSAILPERRQRGGGRGLGAMATEELEPGDRSSCNLR
jgi:hypothetical protein